MAYVRFEAVEDGSSQLDRRRDERVDSVEPFGTDHRRDVHIGVGDPVVDQSPPEIGDDR